MDNKAQKCIEEFNSMPILNSSNFKEATDQLNTEILRTMDKIAPKQAKKITSRIRKPCYDDDLKTTKADSEKHRKKMAQI